MLNACLRNKETPHYLQTSQGNANYSSTDVKDNDTEKTVVPREECVLLLVVFE
jgi:hypothetical protein